MPSDEHTALTATNTLPANALLLPIVVGARLEAELIDRPLAYRLAQAMRLRQQDDDGQGLSPVVCTDLWYLNDNDLQARPAVTIGEPDVNAATACLARRLPTAFVIEGSLRIQLDLELLDLRACLWGADASAMATCLDLFVDRYLDDFLQAAKNA